jgi:23S rRNA pseudouridine2605 synthase
MKERLQKLMAMAGIGSRRANEELIKAGRVRVNGKVAQLGDSADLSADTVEVDGVRLNIKATQKRVYYAINKPRNVLAVPTNIHDDDRRTVRELLPYKGHLFSIGRLDADSDGLVVLTNDGELAQKISHPRYRHTKSYRVVVAGLPTAETIQRWETGVFLEEGKTAPCSVKITKGGTKESVLQIVMTEGKKRQIRRVASILGHPAIVLTRTAIGKLELGNLKSGEWRELDEEDVRRLSTPAVELKNIRQRRPTRPTAADRHDDNALPQRGVGKDDDVRSERQRRAARHEPERDAYGRDDERPARPRTRYGERDSAEERPRRPARYDERGERDEERPRRRFERADTPTSDRPTRRPTYRSRDERDQRPAASRPTRKPGTRRDSDRPSNERPAARSPRKPTTRRGENRPGSGTRKPRRPPQKRGRG